jgi:geranylgeranyl reductase family protein
MPARYDAIVVGAGPAGSVTAYRLASAGASVLLLDRARFPRDKPCGGGLTVRAIKKLPFSVDPVVEDVVDRVELGLGYRRRYERPSPDRLILMTQRARLDSYLAEQAAAAGAEFRDGTRVARIEVDQGQVRVEGFRADVVIGADGANGVSARALGLCPQPAYGVALEGNLSHDDVDADRYRGRIVLELGVVRGGYGWVFCKDDHVNVGVGGWEREAPRLREHMTRLCNAHALPEEKLRALRGFRLPIARPGAPLARGRALLVGDAAGLVDPLSGDGMYEAFLSAEYAAQATLDLLAGRSASLEPYQRRLNAALAFQLEVSWAAKVALDRFPRALFAIGRTDYVQRGLQKLARGELQPDPSRRLSRVGRGVLGLLGRGGPRLEPLRAA